MSIYTGQTPKQLYRSFFRYIRHIPDPHVWSILQPRIRLLLGKCGRNVPESSAQGQVRAASKDILWETEVWARIDQFALHISYIRQGDIQLEDNGPPNRIAHR